MSSLTVLPSSFVILVILWTRQILLNMAPYERLKPRVRSHVPRLQATGKTEGLTKRPSRPAIRERSAHVQAATEVDAFIVSRVF